MTSNIFYTACVNVFLLYLLQSWTKAEFFTAIAQMEALLETQKGIIESLDKYVMEEEKRFAVLKSQLRVFKSEHKKAMEDIPDYLGNPISAFTLIKRLTIDLAEIEHINIIAIAHTAQYVKNLTMRKDDVKYPTLEDLAGAAQALTRLQAIYQLDVHDLAEGVLKGIQGHPMTAADCYELARAVYNLTDYNNTIAWSMEALRKFKKESTIEHTMSETEIIEYIIYSHFFIGNVKSALTWAYKLLDLDPDHPQARADILRFEKAIKEQGKRKQLKLRSDVEKKNKAEHTNDTRDYGLAYFEALCRGEVQVPSEITKRLSCHYLTEHHPFLRLAPIKVEQVYIKPDVYMFHEVISDEEIESIQKMALPKFRRAGISEPETDKRTESIYRVSQSAWLHDAESAVIARLSRRVADMTGLSVVSAESLQVGNYGIGGYYGPHLDYGKVSNLGCDKYILRIATVLFYLSDVALGGATVFTELGLSVFPIKHAALFWMNGHPSGEGDKATRHAACPVLRGSKWVANKWLHQDGQELLKPCKLDYREEESLNISLRIP